MFDMPPASNLMHSPDSEASITQKASSDSSIGLQINLNPTICPGWMLGWPTGKEIIFNGYLCNITNNTSSYSNIIIRSDIILNLFPKYHLII